MSILLRHWRERRGYSVRVLGTRARISYVTIVRIENDHTSPTVAMLEKLAQALGIRVRDFFPTAKAETQQKHISKQVAADRKANGGTLTASEKKQVNKEQNAASKSIYNKKHNAKTQPQAQAQPKP